MRTLVVERRLLRRLQRARLGLEALGREVPHGDCAVASRDELRALTEAGEVSLDGLPDVVLLVAAPEGDEATPERAPVEIWRRAFHAAVHAHLTEVSLPLSAVRKRIHEIGQIEFDEVRKVLRAERLLFRTRDDREAYDELAALLLELDHFAPDSVERVLPGLSDDGRVREILRGDVPAARLLEETRPRGAPELVPKPLPTSRTVAPPSLTAPDHARGSAGRIHVSPSRARAVGNVARAAIATARRGGDPTADLEALAARLVRVVGPGAPPEAQLVAALLPLAQRAARSAVLRPVEARVLLDVQTAVVEGERARKTVDVVTWLATLFRRSVVRELPAVGPVRAARALRHAHDKAAGVRLPRDEEEALVRVLTATLHAAEDRVKELVVDAVERTLTEVGLVPTTLPEEVAREKLAHELTDQILERGGVGLGHLRDALSRSYVKMPNVTLSELLSGDALLRADRRLSERLDGVHRRGEIYMRALQKVSSVAFGTTSGRLLVLYFALPVLASYVTLEGLQHLIHPLLRLLGLARGHHPTHPATPIADPTLDPTALLPPELAAPLAPPPPHGPHLLHAWSLGLLSLFVFGLLHARPVRQATLAAVGWVGLALRSLFVTLPAWTFSRPWILRLLASRLTSITLKPLALGAPVYLGARRSLGIPHALGVTSIIVVATATLLGTRVGERLEEKLSDALHRAVRVLRGKILPGLFAVVTGVFRALVERVDRAIYAVDEHLTFQQRDSPTRKIVKGVLGSVWFFVTYVVRIYVNLLIEPQVNPIKHFPVVTVSHKMMLPLAPTLIAGMSQALSPVLGKALATTFSSTTVLLLPGVFGFLVWELKENWALYAQNRPPGLGLAVVGHHGETVQRLLVPGFHSGTLPRLFGRLRARARRGGAGIFAVEEAIHEVEHAVALFVERELTRMLERSPRFGHTFGPVRVCATSNRLKIELALAARPEDGSPPAPVTFAIEEQSGRLLAGLLTHGFLEELEPAERRAFSDALAGLYARAGIALVREQVSAALGGAPFYVSSEGLVAWPDGSYVTEVVYPLDDKRDELVPILRAGSAPAKRLRARDVLFAAQALSYADWVRAWGDEGAQLPEVLPR